jgi:hypothetical protein
MNRISHQKNFKYFPLRAFLSQTRFHDRLVYCVQFAKRDVNDTRHKDMELKPHREILRKEHRYSGRLFKQSAYSFLHQMVVF